MKTIRFAAVITHAFLLSAVPAQDTPINTLKAVAKVGPKKAQAAMKDLAQAGPAAMLPILKGFKGADPVAANWLRAAFEASASRVIKNGQKLPAQLTEFVEDKSRTNDGRARRLAYDWMLKTDPKIADRMIPAMLHDPVPEFRRDAIRRLIDQAKKALEQGDKDAAKKIYEKALGAAIHNDQVGAIVKPLAQLGREVDLQKHFGFLPSWSVVGPFNNKEGVGFAAVYPPEKKLDLNAELEGENGTVKWQKVSTDDKYGNVNISKKFKNYKGSCMYATTEFKSDRDQVLELRLATPNAWKLWVNGEMVFGREEYHRTPQSLVMDHYRVPVKLKAGTNRLLLKVCQNEQEQDWAQRYEFKVRICDKSGTAVREAVPRKSASTR